MARLGLARDPGGVGTGPNLGELERVPQAHYRRGVRKLLRFALRAFVAVVVVGGAWFGVTRFVRWRAEIRHSYAGRNAAAAALDACGPKTGQDKGACYAEALSDQLAASGVADAAAMLKEVAAVDRDVELAAHVLAHGLGIAAYKRKPSVPDLFVACGEAFSSGCRHGAIQAYFQSQSRVGSAEVRGLCEPFHQTLGSNYLMFQCVHGMGHGLTMFHAYDVPKALAACDLLERDWDRQSCYGGVFMENIVSATAPEHPASQLGAAGHQHHGAMSTFKALDPTDPLYPCSIMARRYLYSCYMMQTSAILHLNHGDIAAAGRTCASAPAPWPNTCFASLGRDITSYAQRDPAETARLCRLGAPHNLGSCYDGAVKALVDWTATTETGFAFCAVLGDDPAAPRCYQALGSQVAALMFNPLSRAEQCEQAPRPAAVAACREGAGLPT